MQSHIWDTRNLSARALVRRRIELGWAQGNMDVFDESFATGYTHHDCGYFPDSCDLSDYREWLASSSCCAGPPTSWAPRSTAWPTADSAGEHVVTTMDGAQHPQILQQVLEALEALEALRAIAGAPAG